MRHAEIDSLTIAIRVYPSAFGERRERSSRVWRRPDELLVFDTETRTDASQRLTFGSYRYIEAGKCLEEGIFYADDLPQKELIILRRYVAKHRAETDNGGVEQILLLTRREFLEKLHAASYKVRCVLVGFNLPFDLSRVACGVSAARGRFAGGFSLEMWTYIDRHGRERPHQYRPRIGIKKIDSKRALKGFTARNDPDSSDLIPEGSETGQPEPGYVFRGHFLDLRTLTFALTDRGLNLAGACQAFGVEHGKTTPSRHGIVTKKYIDYNRRDVLATCELAVKLLGEYDRHPIADQLQVTKAYSPASIGKAYLRVMGITPVLERQPDFPKEYLGYAQSAFFGGRTSAHIRKISVPIVATDFLSMYPTVNLLMGLWGFVTAHEIKVVEHCQSEIEALLRRIKPDDLFLPGTWKHLTGFVRVIPNGDILPSRAKYSAESNDWQVAVNHMYPQDDDPKNAVWFSLPDVVASVLLTGRVPKIVDAFRIEPVAKHPGLQPTKLRGSIEIDPSTQDFFKVVIEERKRLSARTDLSVTERERLDKALKVLANAASYGIYAEMNRKESEEKVRVTCHGIDAEPFACRVAHPDEPGEFCFPPLAALITGAARLMLALLEHCVTAAGGTYAMEDTDSMAIVATEHGGLVACRGGSLRTTDGLEAVCALSWKQVRAISDRFAALSPYDREAIPGSVLKIEDDNFDPVTKEQRQLYCYAISAKRYVFLLRDRESQPVLLRKGRNNARDRWSEHGLGHLLNPTDPDCDDREWIGEAWLNIVRRADGETIPSPTFASLPAVGRISISSPASLRPLANLNAGRPYSEQVKPFNFLLTSHVQPFGHPIGADPTRFHLVAPYELDSRQWLKSEWIDQYTGKRYRIVAEGHHGSRKAARVKTYADVLCDYEIHPESKCADAGGRVCGKGTLGLLHRRHVRVGGIKYIGKESNSIDEVDAGTVHEERAVYTEYPDPRRDEWQSKILPALKKLPLNLLVNTTGLSRRALIDLRAGRSRPHPGTLKKIKTALIQIGAL